MVKVPGGMGNGPTPSTDRRAACPRLYKPHVDRCCHATHAEVLCVDGDMDSEASTGHFSEFFTVSSSLLM